MNLIKLIFAITAAGWFLPAGFAQIQPTKTYCNPIDIDYTYMVYNSSRNISYRSGADPVVVEFRGEYYMFVTRSFGYWQNNFHPTLKEGYMEGASMTKHNGKYYLQYAAPGTQFNVYADGVYIGDSPLVPFSYMKKLLFYYRSIQ